MTFCLRTCQINFIAVSPLEFVEDENDCIAMQILVYGDVLSHRTSCKFQASVRDPTDCEPYALVLQFHYFLTDVTNFYWMMKEKHVIQNIFLT